MTSDLSDTFDLSAAKTLLMMLLLFIFIIIWNGGKQRYIPDVFSELVVSSLQHSPIHRLPLPTNSFIALGDKLPGTSRALPSLSNL